MPINLHTLEAEIVESQLKNTLDKKTMRPHFNEKKLGAVADHLSSQWW
jgi:hypothetical protein